MAIPCKDLFELVLIKYQYGQKQEERVSHCTEQLEELIAWPQPYTLEVVENTDYDLYFNTEDADARLYIEGLEYTPSDKVYYDHEMKQYYRKTEAYPFHWFKWDQSEQGLIPGQYYVKVSLKGKMYYTLLKVYPLRIEQHELERMKIEVKNFLGNMQDSILKEQLCKRSIHTFETPQQKALKVLKEWDSKLVPILLEMGHNPHGKIEKSYHYGERSNSHKVDALALRKTLGQKYDPSKGYSYKKQIAYDTPENRWFKYFNEKLISFLEKLREEGILAQEHLQIKEVCQSLRKQQWYEQLPTATYEKFPLRGMYESRLRMLHAFAKNLWQEEKQWQLEQVEAHLYEQTSWLYEVWGYIQIYRLLLEELGFMCEASNFKTLDFWLSKGSQKLHLCYDKFVPIHIHESNKWSSPLYAVSPLHRRPDGRLDLYEGDDYMGSIIIEFKYSHMNNVWHEDRRTRCSEQLLHYGYQMQSVYKANPYGLKEQVLKQLNPIKGVLTLLPCLRYNQTLEQNPETSVTLAALKPEASVTHLKHYFETLLDF